VSAEPESRVYVEAGARLHFGVLDLRGELGRWFGGIGAAASAPTLLLSAQRADTLVVDGEDAARATEFAGRFREHYGIRRGAHLRVHRALPAHAGLGSGTQLALAVARALGELYDISIDAPGLARAVGRARRSAIGTWTFDKGGLVVEGGRPREGEEYGPLIARLAFPADWRCVVAIPDAAPGLSGTTEEEAFARLAAPPQSEVERVAHVVLMGLLPALADGDLPAFGAALSHVQEVTGRWFAAVQGSTFAPGPTEDLVRRMGEWGACGVGQSSWGPTVYGILRGEAAAKALADKVREVLGPRGTVHEGPFRTEGARVWRASA
jgi:beta-ribofuranosylaminobenzene 5'-phosphate synthase